jgi:hypothetical protein
VQSFFEEVIQSLSGKGVEFLVVGGMSAVLQGAAIVTKDVDLCYRRTPENIRKLAEALAPLNQGNPDVTLARNRGETCPDLASFG